MAKEKMNMRKYGPYAFYVALVLAVVLAFLPPSVRGVATLVLALLGLAVGILNISEKEMHNFLLACLAWMVAGSSLSDIVLGMPFGSSAVGLFVVAVLGNIVTFIGPAAAVVAIMALYRLTRD